MSAPRFTAGQRVRVGAVDPPHHTRLPRYVRGRTGEVVECQGSYPRPEDRVRGLPAAPEPVYTVRFAARDLWGEGTHAVTVDLWESYLSATPEAAG